MKENSEKLQAFRLAVQLEHLLNRLPIGNKTSQAEIRSNPTETIGNALRTFAIAEPAYSESAIWIADRFETFTGLNLDTAMEEDKALIVTLAKRLKELSDAFVKDNK